VIERDPLKIKPIPFVQFSALWIAISLVVIGIGVAGMVMNKNNPHINAPFNYGIDYTGGDLIAGTVGKDVTSKEIFDIASKYSSVEPVVQVVQEGGLSRSIEIRTRIKFDPTATPEQQNTQREDNLVKMKEELKEKFEGFELKSQDYVGPTVGKELINKAIVALAIGSALILIYIFFRFGNFLFAISAILALLHDVMITLGGAALMKLEISQSFIAVILTIIGYSINDTIIIYDRIRENMKKYPTLEFNQLCNLSLTQTLTRSINTVVTVVIMLLGLIFFGGESIRDFAVAMLIGIVSGAYSSIFIATPLIIMFRGKEEARTAKSVAAAEFSSSPAPADRKTKPARPAAAAAAVSKAESIEPEFGDEVQDEQIKGTAAEDEAARERKRAKKGKARRR
jgi:preprotein translocase subunit SecF